MGHVCRPRPTEQSTAGCPPTRCAAAAAPPPPPPHSTAATRRASGAAAAQPTAPSSPPPPRPRPAAAAAWGAAAGACGLACIISRVWFALCGKPSPPLPLQHLRIQPTLLPSLLSPPLPAPPRHPHTTGPAPTTRQRRALTTSPSAPAASAPRRRQGQQEASRVTPWRRPGLGSTSFAWAGRVWPTKPSWQRVRQCTRGRREGGALAGRFGQANAPPAPPPSRKLAHTKNTRFSGSTDHRAAATLSADDAPLCSSLHPTPQRARSA